MTTIEYDLDLTGGLMEEIHRLVKPPDSDDKSRRLRVKERIVYRRPGKIPNHDCCDSCKEGGDLLCCDRCPAAFHLNCHDPPLEEEDVPPGEWLCHYCITKPHAEDDDTGSSCSSKSRQSDISQLPISAMTKRPIPTTDRRLGAGNGDFPELDLADMTDEDRANPLKMLARASKVLNPAQFELPKDVVCPINFPGSSKLGALKRKPGRSDASRAALAKQRNVIESDKGVVPLPAKLCFMCSRSCRISPLLQCDYCPLLFHLDCLNPPFTAPPNSRWMCPNHVEHVLDERLLGSVKVTERVRLWDKYTGPIDADAVKLQFLNKVHSKNPIFRYKQVHPHRLQTKHEVHSADIGEGLQRLRLLLQDTTPHCPAVWRIIAVPDAIKVIYASVKNCKPSDRSSFVHSMFRQSQYQQDAAAPPSVTVATNSVTAENYSDLKPTKLDSDHTSSDVKQPWEPYLNLSDISFEATDDSEIASDANLKDNPEEMDVDGCAVNNRFQLESVVKQENIDAYCEHANADKDNAQVVSDFDEQCTDLKPSMSFISNSLPDYASLGVRALFCPISSKEQPAISMKSKTLTIGTGSNMDVCLSLLGHCNLASVMHACIFFDELSGEYELMNYSDFGTTVNDVFYASDYIAPKRPAVVGPKLTSKQDVDMKPSLLSTVRQLVHATKSLQKNGDAKSVNTGAVVVDEKNTLYPGDCIKENIEKPCRCQSNDMRLASENRYGWDGSALVYHGSNIRIGCFEFVFCVVGHASFDDTLSVAGD